MSEFEINGRSYRAAKMDARRQFHVARRFAPALDGIAAAAQADGDDQAMKVATVIGDFLGTMSQTDADYVLDQCLSTVSYKDGERWHRLTTDKGQLMDDTLGMVDMVMIVWRVMEDALGGFFASARLVSEPAPQG